MPERNRLQAMFPRGSRVIHNPAGTAPGIDLEMPRPGKSPARIFALPGVPAEMHEMWQQTVAPAIAAMMGKPRVIRHKQIKCFGVGESDLEQMLPDMIRRGRDPLVGITVHGATITLRITASGDTARSVLSNRWSRRSPRSTSALAIWYLAKATTNWSTPWCDCWPHRTKRWPRPNGAAAG